MHLVPLLGDLRLDQVTYAVVEDFKIALSKRRINIDKTYQTLKRITKVDARCASRKRPATNAAGGRARSARETNTRRIFPTGEGATSLHARPCARAMREGIRHCDRACGLGRTRALSWREHDRRAGVDSPQRKARAPDLQRWRERIG